MTFVAYCIVPAGVTPPPGLEGVGGATVRPLPAGDVCCWASRLETVPTPGPALARTHNAVIMAAMDRDVTPVPIRFGQSFADEDALVAAVARRSTEWQAQLRRFAGHAEFGVRISPTADATSVSAGGHADAADATAADAADSDAARDVHSPMRSGRAFMEGLARRKAQQDRHRHSLDLAATRIAERLGPLVAAARLEHDSVPGRGASLAHMVAWNDVDAYHAVMAELGEELSAYRLHVAGPWPPWSFVE